MIDAEAPDRPERRDSDPRFEKIPAGRAPFQPPPPPSPVVISSQAWMRRAARLNGLSLTSFTIPFFPRDKVAGKQFMPLIPRPRPGGGLAPSRGDGVPEPGLRPLNRKLGRSRKR